MPLLIGGVLIFLGVVVLFPAVLRMDARTLAKALKWGLGGLVALALIWLILTGRLASAVAAGGVAATMLLRWGPLLTRVAMYFRARHKAGNSGWHSTGSADDSDAAHRSTVDSAYLSMTLDHDTASMDGTVRQGRFKDRRLGTLQEADLLALLNECAADAESARLLQAYLDRRFGVGWRQATGAGSGGAATGDDHAMTRAEALAELGLREGADEAQIREAYRRRMRAVHPDHGGSDAQAARVNRARDILLGR
jgi:hypothetical protein